MDALLLTFLLSGVLSVGIGNVNASLEEEIVKQLASLTHRVEQLELKDGLSLRLKQGLRNQKKTTAGVAELCKTGLSRIDGTVAHLKHQINDNFSKLNNSLASVKRTVATDNINCNNCGTGGPLPGTGLTSSSVKSCGDPGIPNNGRKDLHRYSVGSALRFSCKEGYELVGEMDTVCLVSAQWSNPTPTCREIKCPSLNNPPHGRIVGTVRTNGSSVTLKCNEGYLSTGPSTALCQQDETWTNQPFRCQVKRCGDPGTPNNGRKYSNLDSVGSTVRYSCNEGYELVGERDTVCLVSAQWSNTAPSCKEIKCPSLNNPENGRIVGTVRTKGSSVTLKCNDGHLSAGPSTALCQQDKTWTNQPFRCQAIDCGPAPSIPNAYTEVISATGRRDYVIIKCFENATSTSDSATLVAPCGDDGLWRHGQLPDCLGCCSVEQHLGDNTLPFIAGEGCIPHGQSRRLSQFSCAGHFDLDASNREVQCNNGSMLSGIRCQSSERCVVNKPRHNVVSMYRDQNGKTISVGVGVKVRQGTVMLSRCRDFAYYKFAGDSRRVCQHEQWSGIEPACILVIQRYGESRQYYSPHTDVTVTDQGKLRVKQGVNLQLICTSTSRYVTFSSSRGLDDTLEVKTSRLGDYYKTTLDIKDIGVRHSGAYFCINSQSKVHEAEFIVSVY